MTRGAHSTGNPRSQAPQSLGPRFQKPFGAEPPPAWWQGPSRGEHLLPLRPRARHSLKEHDPCLALGTQKTGTTKVGSTQLFTSLQDPSSQPQAPKYLLKYPYPLYSTVRLHRALLSYKPEASCRAVWSPLNTDGSG